MAVLTWYELDGTLTETGFLIFPIAIEIYVPEAAVERKTPEITNVFAEGIVAVVPPTTEPPSLTTMSFEIKDPA